MMANPRVGQIVRVGYSRVMLARIGTRASVAPLQDALVKVVIVSKGKPRNHGVELDGRLYIVPCGNLHKIGGETGRERSKAWR